MNKIIKYSLLLLVVIFTSCEEGEKFSGSPVGVLEVITLKSTISSNLTSALTDQFIDVTVTLDNNITFNDVVEVEIVTEAISGVKTKDKIKILPGQNFGTGKIKSVGGSIYKSSFKLYASAILLNTVVSGKHYLITSNTLNLDTSSVKAPTSNPNFLIMRLVWPSPGLRRNLEFGIQKPGASTVTTVNTLTDFKVHQINNEGSENTVNASSSVGDYILSVRVAQSPNSLVVSPVDMPFKFVFAFPDGTVKFFDFTYINLTPNSPRIQYLRVNKSVVAGQVTYAVNTIP